MIQHIGKFVRDDGETEIEVMFTITPGDPGAGPSYASGGHPPSDPEIEIDRAWLWVADPDPADKDIELSERETARIMQEIAESDELTDDGPDPDDMRDAMIDRWIMGEDT